MLKKSAITVALSFGALLSLYILFCVKNSTGAVMPKTITVTSSAFNDGATIPHRYTGEGADVSPQLVWKNIPADAQSLVIICEDPDAPGGTWVHWVVYDLPATIHDLPENANIGSLGGTLGKNSFDSQKNTTYSGPMPPKGHGPHRYYFKVYALGKKLGLPAEATKEAVETAMQEGILAYGELIGTFERK